MQLVNRNRPHASSPWTVSVDWGVQFGLCGAFCNVLKPPQLAPLGLESIIIALEVLTSALY